MSISRCIEIDPNFDIEIELACSKCDETLEWEDGSDGRTLYVEPCKTCKKVNPEKYHEEEE